MKYAPSRLLVGATKTIYNCLWFSHNSLRLFTRNNTFEVACINSTFEVAMYQQYFWSGYVSTILLKWLCINNTFDVAMYQQYFWSGYVSISKVCKVNRSSTFSAFNWNYLCRTCFTGSSVVSGWAFHGSYKLRQIVGFDVVKRGKSSNFLL